ncbi:MAG: DUF4595 domain-containing protein [Pseudoflavonifractor sp.]|nr:DUF4595 domain-containing protein [Pseudoflavonifractor sp.]
MKKFFKTAVVALATLSSVSLASCGDDDDKNEPDGGNGTESVKPNPTQVFTQGEPTQWDGKTITRNAEGLVTSITDRDETVTFDYIAVSRATNYDMTMTITENDPDGDKVVFYIQLNSQGFIKYALEVFDDPDDDDESWEFGYNDEGQLNYMKRSESNETTNVEYADGSITKVTMTSPGNQPSVSNINYQSGSSSPRLANKGNIMLFDTMFDIDMDEMGVAYFAGLLGKSTKYLPVGRTYAGESDSYTFDWTLNGNGLPVKMVSTWHNGMASYTDETITFAW